MSRVIFSPCEESRMNGVDEFSSSPMIWYSSLAEVATSQGELQTCSQAAPGPERLSSDTGFGELMWTVTDTGGVAGAAGAGAGVSPAGAGAGVAGATAVSVAG